MIGPVSPLSLHADSNYRLRKDIKIVPIVVGAISKEKEAEFGALIAPYLARDDTFTVVSSDFCHW